MVGQAEIADMARQEIEQGGYPFPQELIESLIKVESGWRPGVINPKSGASGLMQVMEIALKDYNLHNWPKLTMADLQGQSLSSIKNQLKTGIWCLGTFWRGAYNYLQPRTGTVPVDELVKIADLFYVAGPGATKRKLEKLPVPSYDALVSTYPTWNALPHVQKVWAWTTERNPYWDLEAIDKWVRKGNEPIVAGFDGHLGAFLLGSILLLFAWYMLSEKRKKHE